MIKLFTVIVAVLFLIFILFLIRKKMLEVKYAYYWIVLSILLVFFSLNTSFLIVLQKFLGFEVLSNFLFYLAIFVILVLLVIVTSSLSSHSKKIRRLSQDLALLKMEKSKNDIPK